MQNSLSKQASRRKLEIGGWWLVWSQKNFDPSGNSPCIVSPSIGLKGLFYPQHIYILLTANATTSFNLSSWSLLSAAFLKKLGANVHISQILWIDDQGSNIFIGKEMCDIDSPFKRLTASYFATWAKTPFYFSSATKSEHISPPDSGKVKP